MASLLRDSILIKYSERQADDWSDRIRVRTDEDFNS
jgi:hypothetical protein